MKIENIRVLGMEGAFRGLRNPMNSWKRSDSQFGLGRPGTEDYSDVAFDKVAQLWLQKNNMTSGDEQSSNVFDWLMINGQLYYDIKTDCFEYAFIGPADMDLAQRMIIAGTSDRKFLRQIIVSMDITAPMYWFSEFDTYKVATVSNSTSKMHKIHTRAIDATCFEMDDYCRDLVLEDKNGVPKSLNNVLSDVIMYCQSLRQKYNQTKDKRYWKELIRILPESWLQKRTVTLNYETLRTMYFQRRDHKLTQWRYFCKKIEKMPYGLDLVCYERS